MSDHKQIAVSDLVWREECQARERMSGETVEKYADHYRDGTDLDPLDVFEVDGELVIVDGFHRIDAAKRAGVVTLPVRVVGKGTLKDAILEAVGKNGKHGLPRSRADVRKAVRMVVEIMPDSSNREIARITGVSHPTVAKLRRGEQLRIPPVQADPEELRQAADEDFREGDFGRAKVLYEKAIAATPPERIPLRAEIATAPQLCAERMAPQKRVDRIGSAYGRLCTICGLVGSAGLDMVWTKLAFCPACLDVMQEKVAAMRVQQTDQAEAAE